ncbi:hypothetical protein [Burkholderia stabilis]|uniref:hypothetical protein n=1 Tax=Burkholderia stabilis TaxID=95485 RepID=UPI001647B9CD|nr:hypothetical protein [Burkholderia stabilis]GAU06893.1 hypothetical protein BSLA_03f1046 [Burkholderia stabilis]
MMTTVHLLRPADVSADRSRASTGGTDNAFDQLLRSMEQDMWSNAASALPAGRPAQPAPGKPASAVSRAGASCGVEQGAAPATTTPQAKAVGTTAVTDHLAGSVAQMSVPTVQGQRENAARSANAYQAPCPIPQPGRPGQPAANATGSTERLANAARSRNVPAAYVSPPPTNAPFRVTILPGDGAPFVSLRVAQADAEDLETLDSHVRAALQQSGFRTSKLVVNGIDRNAPGETPHGD